MNIDQSFQAYKRQHIKTVYKIQLNRKENYSVRRIISKILILGKNNQYGYAMTKPLPRPY